MLHVKHRFKNSYSHWQLNLQFTQLNYDYNKRLLAAMHINWIRRRFYKHFINQRISRAQWLYTQLCL